MCTGDGAGPVFCSSSSFCSAPATVGLYDTIFADDFIFCWRLLSDCNRSSLLRNGRIANLYGFFGAGVVVTGSSEPAKK